MGQKILAVLKGDRINRGYLQEHVWLFRRADKKSGHNNEVTVLLRWPLGGVSLYFSSEFVVAAE